MFEVARDERDSARISAVFDCAIYRTEECEVVTLCGATGEYNLITMSIECFGNTTSPGFEDFAGAHSIPMECMRVGTNDTSRKWRQLPHHQTIDRCR